MKLQNFFPNDKVLIGFFIRSNYGLYGYRGQCCHHRESVTEALLHCFLTELQCRLFSIGFTVLDVCVDRLNIIRSLLYSM